MSRPGANFRLGLGWGSSNLMAIGMQLVGGIRERDLLRARDRASRDHSRVQLLVCSLGAQCTACISVGKFVEKKGYRGGECCV